MLAFVIVFQSIPPVLSLIIHELGISHSEAGLLMGLFALPGIFLAIPGGLLSDYYGGKRIGAISLGLMFVGTAVSTLSPGFYLLAAGRLIAGIGALTFVVVAPQILSQWFFKNELGLAMGIFNTAVPLGTIIVFNTFGRLGTMLSWRLLIFITMIFSLAALFIFLLLFRSPPVTENSVKSDKLLTNPFKIGIDIWLVGGAWMWFNAGIISFMTFAPDYFVLRGYDIGYAGFLASIVMFGSLVLSPIIGYLTHRFGGKEIFIASGGILLTIILLLIPMSGLSIIPLMIFLGIAAALIPAPIFSLPPDILPPAKLGLGFGIITTLVNVGIMLGPYFVGLVTDITGEYEASFLLMAVLTFLTSPFILILRIKRKSPSPE
jgi:MFS family permease